MRYSDRGLVGRMEEGSAGVILGTDAHALIISMPFTISLLSCFKTKGLLPGWKILLVMKVDRELVKLEIQVLFKPPSKVAKLKGKRRFHFHQVKDSLKHKTIKTTSKIFPRF